MQFLLEILDFFKNQKEKINSILEKDFNKKLLIFPVFYGISLWSQLLKSSGAGEKLEKPELFIGIFVTGPLIGIIIFYFYSYILSKLLEAFSVKLTWNSCKNIYVWCLSPFIVSSFLILIEFILGGKEVYSISFLTLNNHKNWLPVFVKFTSFVNTIISLYFVVSFTRLLSYTTKIHWLKALLFLFVSAIISMLPLFLIKF